MRFLNYINLFISYSSVAIIVITGIYFINYYSDRLKMITLLICFSFVIYLMSFLKLLY